MNNPGLTPDKEHATLSGVQIFVTPGAVLEGRVFDVEDHYSLADVGIIVTDVQAGTTFQAVTDEESTYGTRIDLTATLGLFVDFEAGIDLNRGIATWHFIAVDPLTGDLVSDALAGFLPPNVTRPERDTASTAARTR